MIELDVKVDEDKLVVSFSAENISGIELTGELVRDILTTFIGTHEKGAPCPIATALDETYELLGMEIADKFRRQLMPILRKNASLNEFIEKFRNVPGECVVAGYALNKMLKTDE